jgi:opacity protein-like surface antigen
MLSVISRNFVGIVCVSSLLIAAPLSAADAADIPTKAPPLVAPGTAWTSCYINGGAGYGMWNQQHTDLTTFGGVPGTTISQTDGAMVGLADSAAVAIIRLPRVGSSAPSAITI